MISVCIPVFNVDVRKLAETLSSQAEDLSREGIPVEIILLDDGSDLGFRETNRILIPQTNIPGNPVHYHELGENIGRSRIRNRFIKYAGYSHLLFLDCDSEILSEDFLRTYKETINRIPDRVICGGRVYFPKPPGRNQRLHWKYGTLKESQPAEVRKQHPSRSFMTNNFLIPLNILKETGFDERLSGYGHEDSLFGYELSRKNQQITHIDNPVLHGVLESNSEFVEKTGQAVQNLIAITEMLEDDPEFTSSITLLSAVRNLESRNLSGLIRILSYIFVPVSRMLLSMGVTSLKLLDLYKLGLYLTQKKKN